jgi:hypothetical protein
MNNTNLGIERSFKEFKATRKENGKNSSPALRKTHNQTMTILFWSELALKIV